MKKEKKEMKMRHLTLSLGNEEREDREGGVGGRSTSEGERRRTGREGPRTGHPTSGLACVLINIRGGGG